MWKGQLFGRATLNLSAGIEKGWKGAGKALTDAFTPKVRERLELVPAFRSGVGTYSVTIGYRETGVTILASAMQPGQG